MSKALNLFAKRVELFLAEKGWTQADLARSTGMSAQQISNYVKARTPPGLETIEKIAQSLEKPVWKFFKDEITIRAYHVPDDLAEIISGIPTKRMRDLKDVLEQFAEIDETQTVKKS